MKKIMSHFAVIMLLGFWASLGVGQAAAAVYAIQNPGGLDSQINSLDKTMEYEIGTYSIAEFNADPEKLVFTFDDQHGYNVCPSGNQIGSITLTKAVSGVDMVVTFDQGTSSFGRVRSQWRGTSTYESLTGTPGDPNDAYTLAFHYEQTIIRFSKPVYGVGLTINRVYPLPDPNDDFVLELFNGVGELVGSSYVIPPNSSPPLDPDPMSEHSFFGYYNPNVAEVQRVVMNTPGMVTPGSSQFAIDDLAMIAGVGCETNAGVGDINKDCKVNLNDLYLMASNWLETMAPE